MRWESWLKERIRQKKKRETEKKKGKKTRVKGFREIMNVCTERNGGELRRQRRKLQRFAGT